MQIAMHKIFTATVGELARLTAMAMSNGPLQRRAVLARNREKSGSKNGMKTYK
jgi:hypothetical protein